MTESVLRLLSADGLEDFEALERSGLLQLDLLLAALGNDLILKRANPDYERANFDALLRERFEVLDSLSLASDTRVLYLAAPRR